MKVKHVLKNVLIVFKKIYYENIAIFSYWQLGRVPINIGKSCQLITSLVLLVSASVIATSAASISTQA